jgi:hypothetical protein
VSRCISVSSTRPRDGSDTLGLSDGVSASTGKARIGINPAARSADRQRDERLIDIGLPVSGELLDDKLEQIEGRLNPSPGRQPAEPRGGLERFDP